MKNNVEWHASQRNDNLNSKYKTYVVLYRYKLVANHYFVQRNFVELILAKKPRFIIDKL